ncbi:MAG: cysteine dioxygenase [Betaproteobacteria bacterium]|nr:cysteine dioxygenase [Betaproteobacteria bacterium]
MNIARLRQFVTRMTRLVEQGGSEAQLLEQGQPLLADLITHDDWLPEEFARPHAERYQQYLLYCDPYERFSLASFIWGPGQATPVHDHTVWGMVGVMRGAELCEEYAVDAAGKPGKTGEHRIAAGGIDLVSPTIGDIHTVSNPLTDQVSVSIHCYGANIGAVKRHIYAPGGEVEDFISGYASATMPNLWDRSKETAPG